MKTNLREFAKPWAKLCAAHPRIAVSAATLKVYHERLCRFDIDKIAIAMDICIDLYDFFPSVPQIKKAIDGLPAPRHKLLDEPKPSAEKAAVDRNALKELIEQSAKTMESRMVNEEERRAFLKKQAAIITAAARAPADAGNVTDKNNNRRESA